MSSAPRRKVGGATASGWFTQMGPPRGDAGHVALEFSDDRSGAVICIRACRCQTPTSCLDVVLATPTNCVVTASDGWRGIRISAAKEITAQPTMYQLIPRLEPVVFRIAAAISGAGPPAMTDAS
jgi:hypothetical protein